MKEEDVRRALCYDRYHKQLRVDGRDPVPDRLGDTVVSLPGLQPVRAVEVRLQQTSPPIEDVVGDGRTVVKSRVKLVCTVFLFSLSAWSS